MKFHTPSFLLGVGLTAAAFSARARLRPVVVEVAALGVHLGRLGRGLVERQRESVEDLWAEVEERVRDRARAVRRHVTPAEPERRPFANGQSAARN